MNTTRTSLLFSFAEKYTLLLLGIAGSMLLARLLTPRQIGVFSVGAVVVGMAQLIRDFGIGQYLIQEAQLSTEKIRAAFTLTLMIAWSVALLLFFGSAAVARFYGEPLAGEVLRVLAVNCALVPFGSITMPCLRRRLRFGALYCINAVSGLANFATGVGLALAGFGTMSLAWAALAGTLGAVLTSLAFRPHELPWRPGLRGIGQLLSFGVYATGANLLDESGVAAPDLIIGKLLGMGPVALFSKAQGVLGLFNQLIVRAVTPVMMALYARQAREGEDMKQAFLLTASYMAALSWPFFAVLAVLAWPCVHLLYGAQWDSAARPLRILCLSAAVFSVFNMARELLVAIGHVRRRARLELLAVPLRIAAIALVAPYGLEAIAWSIVATTLVKALLIYQALSDLTALRWRELAAILSKASALAGLAAAGPLAATLLLPMQPQQVLAPLALAILGALLGWTGGIYLTGHPLGTDLAAALRHLVRRCGASVRVKPGKPARTTAQAAKP